MWDVSCSANTSSCSASIRLPSCCCQYSWSQTLFTILQFKMLPWMLANYVLCLFRLQRNMWLLTVLMKQSLLVWCESEVLSYILHMWAGVTVCCMCDQHFHQYYLRVTVTSVSHAPQMHVLSVRKAMSTQTIVTGREMQSEANPKLRAVTLQLQPRTSVT